MVREALRLGCVQVGDIVEFLPAGRELIEHDVLFRLCFAIGRPRERGGFIPSEWCRFIENFLAPNEPQLVRVLFQANHTVVGAYKLMDMDAVERSQPAFAEARNAPGTPMHVLHKQIDLIVKQRKSTLPGQSAHMLTFTEFSKICRRATAVMSAVLRFQGLLRARYFGPAFWLSVNNQWCKRNGLLGDDLHMAQVDSKLLTSAIPDINTFEGFHIDDQFPPVDTDAMSVTSKGSSKSKRSKASSRRHRPSGSSGTALDSIISRGDVLDGAVMTGGDRRASAASSASKTSKPSKRSNIAGLSGTSVLGLGPLPGLGSGRTVLSGGSPSPLSSTRLQKQAHRQGRSSTAMSVDSAGPRRSVIDIDAEETDGNVSVGFGGPLDQSLHSLSWKGTVNHSSPVPKRPSKARAIVSDEGDNEEDTLGDMAGVGEPDGVKGTSMQSLMRPKKPSAVTFSSMDELFP